MSRTLTCPTTGSLIRGEFLPCTVHNPEHLILNDNSLETKSDLTAPITTTPTMALRKTPLTRLATHLGGGEGVRVCNPCVPDPNNNPPPQNNSGRRAPLYAPTPAPPNLGLIRTGPRSPTSGIPSRSPEDDLRAYNRKRKCFDDTPTCASSMTRLFVAKLR
jgi:hypothetical protein